MDLKLCEYSRIKGKLEELGQIIKNANNELEGLEASENQTRQQLEEERIRKQTDLNNQYENEEQQKREGYNKQLSQVWNVKEEMEQWHQELLSDNRNYNLVYKEMSGNRQIIKEFVDCTDAINTIHNLRIKYSDIYHNSIQKRITNIMLKKRRQEYEYLVVWKNTVDYYLEILPKKLQENLNVWETQRGQEIRNQKENVQDEYTNRILALEKNSREKRQERWNNIADKINQLFPEWEINNFCSVIDSYIGTTGNVNQKELVRDGIFHMSYVGKCFSELAQENHPVGMLLKRKFKQLVDDTEIYMPVLSTAENPFTYFVSGEQREEILRFMEQYLFTWILRVKVSKLALHVADCVYQGESVSFLNTLGRQVPYLFGEGILVREQDVTERLKQLNEKINWIKQEVFLNAEDTIYHLGADTGIDVVVLYDFPNGLTQEGISYLWNIVKEGPACGVYVVISDGNVDSSRYTEDMCMQIERIKQLCQKVTLENENGKIDTCTYSYVNVWDEENFEEQCKQYAIATKVMERSKRLSSSDFIKLATLDNRDFLRNYVDTLHQEVLEQLAVRSKVPEKESDFPEKILIGEILYARALFENRGDAFHVLECRLGMEDFIREPWYLELKKNQNLFVSMKEQDVPTGQRFLHNVLWSCISAFPISKYNICVMDCERKGGSIRPFLELCEQLPELFDENIYTNTESVYQRLQKYNEMIEERIQLKLGNRYKNILEYNKENENNPEVIHTLAIYDFPCGFDSKSIQLLLNILKNGNKCGVYTIIGYNEDIPVEQYDHTADLIGQIKEIMIKIRAVDRKYLLEESACQININLETYMKRSPEGLPYYESFIVYDDDGEEDEDDDEFEYEIDEEEWGYDEDEYDEESEPYSYDVKTASDLKSDCLYVEGLEEKKREKEREALLNTDEYGFLTDASNNYCVELEKWFLSSEDMRNFVSSYVEIVKKKKQEGLVFENVLDQTLFEKSAADVLEIPVGIGDQGKKISISFGEKGTSSHHGLITGATGSGKSSLLHTLIMSAMLHYSPEQLQLYLLDFKNGTEFKIYEDYHLPHIQVLALDSMQEFGESILEKLVQVMEERSVLCKNVNAKNLTDYVKTTCETMPRILVIMDEFQLLYNSSSNSKIAKNCGELTKRLVTEGRAFGIHLLMSTQSARIISSLSLDKEVVGQMRVLIGLKCSEEDTRYLFGDRNEKQAFEWMRGPIGTAVLNEDYVEGKNTGFRVAYCNETTQKELLQKIANRFAGEKSATLVFEGNRMTKLLDALEKEKGKELKGVQIAVGDLLKASDEPLYLTFDKRKSHNTIIAGSDMQMAENLSNGLCYSILQKSDTKVYCLDGEILVGEEETLEVYQQFATRAENFFVAEVYGDIIRFINEVYDTLCRKKKVKDTTTVFLMIKNLQYLDLVKQMLRGERIKESEYIDLDELVENEGEECVMEESVQESTTDFFDFGLGVGDFAKKLEKTSNTSKKEKEELNVSQKLLKIINEGSSVGIHIILSCTEFQSIKETLFEVNMNVNKLIQKFPERFLFALNEMDAGLLMDNQVSIASLPDNMMYYTDSINRLCMVKPFQFPTLEELEKSRIQNAHD